MNYFNNFLSLILCQNITNVFLEMHDSGHTQYLCLNCVEDVTFKSEARHVSFINMFSSLPFICFKNIYEGLDGGGGS